MDANKRNYLLLFMDTVLFTNATTFLSINVMITYFLNELGASTSDIGLANALVSIGAFVSQPIFAKQVMNLPYKLHAFVKILFTQRVFFLLFVLTIPLVAVSHPHLMVVLFLIFWMIFNLFVGSYGPFYVSLFAKMVATNQRGRLKGFSGAIGNVLALGSAFAAGVILKQVPYPYNYTLIFTIGVVILLLDAWSFAFMKEEVDQVTPLAINYFQYFKSIPGLLRENRKFKSLVIGFCFMLVSQVSLAFYALYAVRVYHITGAEVALFTAITGLINIVGSLFFGIVTDKLGPRSVLIVSSLCAAAAGFVVVGIHQLPAVYVAYALTTLCLSGYNICSSIIIIETVQRDKLPMCISVNSMITLVVSAAVTLASSFLIDAFSFSSVFWIAGAAGLFGALAIYGPRWGRHGAEVVKVQKRI